MTKQTDAEVLRSLAQNDRVALEDGQTLERVANNLESDAKRYAQSEELQQIGKNCYECIAEMVAALECDYDRLEELRQLRKDFEPGDSDATWEGLCGDEAEELAELETAAGDCESREDAETRIQEGPLCIELEGKWSMGDTATADKALILLGTGGPATRIVCELDNGEPTRAWVQAQDWFTQWTDYVGGSSDTLLTYCRVFYFGEG